MLYYCGRAKNLRIAVGAAPKFLRFKNHYLEVSEEVASQLEQHPEYGRLFLRAGAPQEAQPTPARPEAPELESPIAPTTLGILARAGISVEAAMGALAPGEILTSRKARQLVEVLRGRGTAEGDGSGDAG